MTAAKTTFYDPCNDVAFKKMFLEHPQRTASFLNALLRLKGERRIQSVEFLPQECLPLIAESKKSILDVRVTDHRNFQYIVEVQNRYLNSYIQRIQYYAAHVYVGQMKKAEDYTALSPVTVLSIQNHTLFPDSVPFLSFHRNREDITGESYLSDMAYAFVELPKFLKTEAEIQTPEDHWVYLLKEARNLDHIPDKAPEEVQSAFHVLEEHTWSELEREAYFKARMAIMDDRDAFKTAHDQGQAAGWAAGLEKGLEKGRQAGREEGLEEGARLKALEIARTLLAQGLDIPLVARTTGLAEDDLETLHHPPLARHS
jgi:predicted transposase/invertase (TIGR01784 family)